MTSPLILVDGSSYFYRAFHALPPLTNSEGNPVGAILGVANMIKRLIKDYQPTYMAVIFDAAGKTFRDDWYPAYKAHRAPTPYDLRCQFTPLVSLLKAMGLPILIIPGVEADDVIGTLTHLPFASSMPILISTGDKDITQLVTPSVTLINTMTNQKLTPQGVLEKFGVPPEGMIDYLTLVGDSADNIPGVHKCGPKTAIKWLQTYQTLENLVEHANDIGGKIGEHLRESLAHLPLSKRLLTIKTDVEIAISLEELSIKTPEKDTLLHLLQEFEFKNWLKELGNVSDNFAGAPPPVQGNIIKEETQCKEMLSSLAQTPLLALHLLFSEKKEVLGLSLATTSLECFYVSLSLIPMLGPLLENTAIKKLGADTKSLYLFLKTQGITLQGITFDTLLASYVLNSARQGHAFENLVLQYLHFPMQPRTSLSSLEQEAEVALAEVHCLLRVQEAIYPLLSCQERSLLEEIEIPLVSVLAEMEWIGVFIDTEVLDIQKDRLSSRILALEEEAIALAGKTFNLLSPKQLQVILFEELQLPVRSKTPKGQASTSEAVLQELALHYRLPAVILEYRGLHKLLSTYIEALPKRIRAHTGRVHTSYNQAVTTTGRLSSSDPNLQNIPVRTEEGRCIRTAFAAPSKKVIVAADYSQIELRIMAHLSQDPSLTKAFALGWDIHQATASEIFDIPLEEVTSLQRRRAKAINFGLIYGMSAFGLAKQLGIAKDSAQQYMDTYFQRYPSVLQFMEDTRNQAHQQGFVETLFHRRLYVPDIRASNLMRRKAAERAAINAPMQGTAADIIKKAMIAIAHWQKNCHHCTMIMQVHDELVFEVAETALAEVLPAIQERMEEAATLLVPLQVHIGIGSNWEEAH